MRTASGASVTITGRSRGGSRGWCEARSVYSLTSLTPAAARIFSRRADYLVAVTAWMMMA